MTDKANPADPHDPDEPRPEPGEPEPPPPPELPARPEPGLSPLARYAASRVAATLNPVAHLQRAPYSGPVEQFTIPTNDGVELAAMLFGRRRRSLIIIAHGFGASQRAVSIVWLAEQLAGLWDTLTFDWRGYGGSSGLASLGGAEVRDLIAVLGYARQAGYERVGVVAESMGGLITLTTLGTATPAEAAFPDRIAAISAPVDYALTGGLRPQMVRYIAPLQWMRPFAPLLGFRLGDVDPARPIEVIDRLSLPLLVIHGDRDSTVPLENAYRIKEHAPHALLRIYGGVDHAIEGMRLRAARRFVADLRAWFSEM